MDFWETNFFHKLVTHYDINFVNNECTKRDSLWNPISNILLTLVCNILPFLFFVIERIRKIYKKKGYQPSWINQREKGIITRNNLTDEWKYRGVVRKDYTICPPLLRKFSTSK